MTLRRMLLLSMTVLLTIMGLTMPSQAQEDSGLEVAISQVSPSVMTSSTKNLVVSGTITNTGSERWENVHAYLVRSRTPYISQERLVDAAGSGYPFTGSRITTVGQFDEVGNLAAGSSTSFRINIPTADLGLQGSNGAYPIGVQILATASDGNRSDISLAQASTFLPWLEGKTSPIDTGLVWPFVLTGPPPTSSASRLADFVTSISPRGQLDNYLEAASRTRKDARTIFLDPIVLDTAAQVVSAERLPREVSITEEQQAAAQRFINRLRTLASESETWIIRYGRPDSLSLANHEQQAASLDKAIEEATTRSLEDHKLTGQTIEWPSLYGVTERLVTSQPEGVPVVVASDQLDDWRSQLGSIVTWRHDGRVVPMLINDRWPDLAGDQTPATMRQQVLTAATLAHMSRSLDPESAADAFFIVDPSWDPGPGNAVTDMTASLTGEDTKQLLRPTTVSRLMNSSPASYTGQLPTTSGTQALSGSYLDAVVTMDQKANTLLDMLTSESTLHARHVRDVAKALSLRWRKTEDEATTIVEARTKRLQTEIDRVSVEGPPSITLSGQSGSFPLTISNNTGHRIRVAVALESTAPSVKLPTTDVVEIAAEDRFTVNVSVDMAQQISTQVSAQVVTAEGVAVGEPVDFRIRTSKVGLVVWIALGLAALGLIIAMTRRFLAKRPLAANLDREDHE